MAKFLRAATQQAIGSVRQLAPTFVARVHARACVRPATSNATATCPKPAIRRVIGQVEPLVRTYAAVLGYVLAVACLARNNAQLATSLRPAMLPASGLAAQPVPLRAAREHVLEFAQRAPNNVVAMFPKLAMRQING